MITIKDYKLLDKVIKAMKCDRYIIFPDRIIGCDINIITISEVIMDTHVSNGCYYEFNTDILKNIRDTIDLYVKDKSADEVSKMNFEKYFEYMSIKYIHDSEIVLSYNRTIETINDSSLYSRIMNAKDDEIFNNCLTLKSADGLAKYYIKNVWVSIFKGLLPINKNDKVGLDTYITTLSSDNNTIYLCKFSIDKKFAVINKYIKYLC